MKITRVKSMSFNDPKSGKSNYSYQIDSKNIGLISKSVMDMIRSGEIESLELKAADEEYEGLTFWRPDPNTIVEATVESRVEKIVSQFTIEDRAKVEIAKKRVELYEANKEILDKAAEASEKLSALGDF